MGWTLWEEFDQDPRGKNFGWLCWEANNKRDHYAAFPVCVALPASAVTFPMYSYNHSEGNSAIGGVFYTGAMYPAPYQGNFFIADYGGAGKSDRFIFALCGTPAALPAA